MTIRVLLFGVLADRARQRERMVSLADGSDVASLLEALAALESQLGTMRGKLAVAVNLEYVKGNHVLKDGDEVAIIPPVSGG